MTNDAHDQSCSMFDDDEIVREIENRLLALPSYTDEELRGMGIDPAGNPLLIWLPRPDGGRQCPAFQIAEGEGAAPGELHHYFRPVVQQVNQILNGPDDPWGVTDWWVGKHAYLGTAPVSLLGDLDQHYKLARLAQAELED